MVTELGGRTVPFVNLAAQYDALRSEIDAAMAEVIAETAFVGGRHIGAFERWFADLCGVRHGVGVSSGTAALELVLEALGVGPGDEVITVPHTFIATAAAILRVGARPVFVDVDAGTFNMDPAQLGSALSPRTRAIVPVHLYGRPAPMGEIRALADARGIPVVEDACQAHGATLDGAPAGSLGRAGCFSFYPAKNLGAFGDGGIVTTDDAALAERVRLLTDHGRLTKYEHAVVGHNERLDTLHAAVLLAQAPQLTSWNAARRRAAGWYREKLAGLDLTLPEEPPDGGHVYHLFVVRTPWRDALADHLRRRGVATGVHYPVPLHRQPALRHLGYESVGAFPVAERLADEVLSLPMHPFLVEEDVEYIAECVAAFFAGR
jgi:dTDP-4-amino-4,6-dideoxygalactose transaminase